MASAINEKLLEQCVGTFPSDIPGYFKNSRSVFGLVRGKRGIYKDNLCFFRNVICAREIKKAPSKFRPQKIKQADVKTLYDMLRTSMPELPYHSKNFQRFTLDEMALVCATLGNNGFIFNAELRDGRPDGHTQLAQPISH